MSIAKCPAYANNNNWVNVLRIDYDLFDKKKSKIIKVLEKNGIQSRPVWGLNHNQKPYKSFQNYHISNAYGLLDNSLLLPSSVSLSNEDIKYIIHILDSL